MSRRPQDFLGEHKSDEQKSLDLASEDSSSFSVDGKQTPKKTDKFIVYLLLSAGEVVNPAYLESQKPAILFELYKQTDGYFARLIIQGAIGDLFTLDIVELDFNGYADLFESENLNLCNEDRLAGFVNYLYKNSDKPLGEADAFSFSIASVSVLKPRAAIALQRKNSAQRVEAKAVLTIPGEPAPSTSAIASTPTHSSENTQTTARLGTKPVINKNKIQEIIQEDHSYAYDEFIGYGVQEKLDELADDLKKALQIGYSGYQQLILDCYLENGASSKKIAYETAVRLALLIPAGTGGLDPKFVDTFLIADEKKIKDLYAENKISYKTAYELASRASVKPPIQLTTALIEDLYQQGKLSFRGARELSQHCFEHHMDGVDVELNSQTGIFSNQFLNLNTAKIFDLFKNKKISLEYAFELITECKCSLPSESQEEKSITTINLQQAIHQYEQRKGWFKKLTDRRTVTMEHFIALQAWAVNKGLQHIPIQVFQFIFDLSDQREKWRFVDSKYQDQRRALFDGLLTKQEVKVTGEFKDKAESATELAIRCIVQ